MVWCHVCPLNIWNRQAEKKKRFYLSNLSPANQTYHLQTHIKSCLKLCYPSCQDINSFLYAKLLMIHKPSVILNDSLCCYLHSTTSSIFLQVGPFPIYNQLYQFFNIVYRQPYRIVGLYYIKSHFAIPCGHGRGWADKLALFDTGSN